jgi:hypothetical protein
MDPNSTWRDLIDSYRQRDWEEASLLAEALLRWLDLGGFPPVTTDALPADDAWHHVVARAVCTFVLQHEKEE